MTGRYRTDTLCARTRDGVEVRARITEREDLPGSMTKTRGSVLFLPAMGVTARYYQGLAEALADDGLGVACLDLRGNGDSDVRIRRGTDFGYWHHMLDVEAAVAALGARYPHGPLLLMGHSLGGQLGALHLAACPSTVDGLVLVAAGTPYWRNWSFPEPLRVLAGTQTALAVATVLGYFPGDLFGFGGTQSVGVIRDWAALSRNGRFDIRGAEQDLEAALARVTTPVLSISLEGDWYSSRRATDHLAFKLASAPLLQHHVTLPHTPAKKSPHFHWTHHPLSIVPLIQSWMNAEGT